MEGATTEAPAPQVEIPPKWMPQIHGNREYWPPIHVAHPPYASPLEETVDEAFVSRYGESTIDDPVSHLVDTSQQFPSEVHPEEHIGSPPRLNLIEASCTNMSIPLSFVMMPSLRRMSY